MEARRLAVRFYTDSYVVSGTVSTTAADVHALLTMGDPDTLELEEVRLSEHSTGDLVRELAFARVAVAAILFAVSDEPDESAAAIALPRLSEKALLIVPPFRLTGYLHAADATDLRSAAGALSGRFLPVSDATHWSESLREPRTSAQLAAVARARVQIVAPYLEQDVWGDSPREPRF